MELDEAVQGIFINFIAETLGDEEEHREQKRWIYKTGILNVRRSK